MVFALIILVLTGLIVFYMFSTMQEMKLKRAEEAVKEGDLDVALSIFMESLRKDPKNVEALWQLGNINEEKRNYLEAIGYYNQLINMGAESTLFSQFELYKRVGILYRKIDRDRDALDNLMQANQVLPSAKEPIYHIGMILLSQKQYYRALPYLEKAGQFYAKEAGFLRNEGLCLLLVGSNDQAVIQLEEEARLFPNDYKSKFLLAVTYLRIGAFGKARETMEEVVNIEDLVLSSEQMFYAVKLLFLCYVMDRNFEVSRDLLHQLETMAQAAKDQIKQDQVNMAFIYMRVMQGYFDLAIERMNELLNIGIDMEGMSGDDQTKVKENKSKIFELLSTLDKHKKEKERAQALMDAGKPVEVEFSLLERKAQEALKEIKILFDDWKDRFIGNGDLVDFFLPKSTKSFDVSLIMDKYSEQNITVMKNKIKQTKQQQQKIDSQFKKLGVDPNNPCESLKMLDFPSLNITAQELASTLGYKVINQAIKLDTLAYSEGQGVDFLCEEKIDKNVRLLFVLRRWAEPVGYITISNLKDALKNFKAQRVVLVSTSPLSDEAQKVVEKDSSFTFLNCEDIAHYLI